MGHTYYYIAYADCGDFISGRFTLWWSDLIAVKADSRRDGQISSSLVGSHPEGQF